MTNKKPKKYDVVTVPDLFSDSNAFAILAKARRAAIRAGWSEAEWRKVASEALASEAQSGSYDHLIQTVLKYFEPADQGPESDDDE